MSAEDRRIVVAAGLVWAGQRVLVQRRAAGSAHGAGSLELPGGKVEFGEAPVDAMRRELVEEWGPRAAELVVGAVAEVLHHDYPPPGPEVILVVFHVNADGWLGELGGPLGPIAAPDAIELVALSLDELDPGEFLAADAPFIARVRDGRVARV